MPHSVDFTDLLEYLSRIPAISPINSSIGPASNAERGWLIKFRIDIAHPEAWATVMDLGYVVNWISVANPLPTRFIPVSAPPDMNGDDPATLLWWIIECWTPEFTPSDIAKAMRTNLVRYAEPGELPDESDNAANL